MSNTDIDNQAPNRGAQAGAIHSVTIINSPHPLPAPSALTLRDRTTLLNRLGLRYQERLEHSLAHQVRLELGIHTRPDAVDPTWRQMLFSESPNSRPIPQATPLLEIFDSQQGQLLVLGAPGAGKTTLMVELALALTERAQTDAQTRIPVLLNVASWRHGQSLRAWLAYTLPDWLGTSQRFAARLADSDDLLLLLDGLDEVAEAHRSACVQAINTYLRERDLSPPVAVSCRSREHADLGVKLQIASAVELEPLDLAAVERALADVPAVQGTLTMLQADPILRELADTPLMINLLLLTYAEQSSPLITAQTDQGRRDELWRAYIRRMLQRRPLILWKPRNALMCLRWLARLLRERGETDFLIDDLQPTMLPSERLRRWYQWLVGLSMGGVGFLVGLYIDPGDYAIQYFGELATRLMRFLLGLLVGWGCLMFFGLDKDSIAMQKIQRQEQIYWSTPQFRERLQKNARFGIITSTISGIFLGLISSPFEGIAFGFGAGLSAAIFSFIWITLFGGMNDGWRIESLRLNMFPMQGVRLSLKTSFIRACVMTLVSGLILGTVFGLVFGLFFGPHTGLIVGLRTGLVIGLFGGGIMGLGRGLDVFFRHHALRLVLARAGLLPFRAVTFLDAMSARLLLERDGAFYRFRHILLRDFIADLSDEELERLV